MAIQHKKSPNTTKINTSGFHQAWYILTESAVITVALLLTPYLGLLLSFTIALATTVALFRVVKTLPKQVPRVKQLHLKQRTNRTPRQSVAAAQMIQMG